MSIVRVDLLFFFNSVYNFYIFWSIPFLFNTCVQIPQFTNNTCPNSNHSDFIFILSLIMSLR